MLWLLGLAYLACSVLQYGLILAFFQREYSLIAHDHRMGDVGCALFMALWGPAGLFSTAVVCGFKHGLMWWPPKQEDLSHEILRDRVRKLLDS